MNLPSYIKLTDHFLERSTERNISDGRIKQVLISGNIFIKVNKSHTKEYCCVNGEIVIPFVINKYTVCLKTIYIKMKYCKKMLEYKEVPGKNFFTFIKTHE